MTCIKCDNENDRDYPACRECSPNLHFTNRTDCLCDDCADYETLYRRFELAPAGSERAMEIAIRLNHRRAMLPATWCEPCFSDACAHCQPQPMAPEKIAAILIENLPKIGNIRFLGATPR